MLDGNFKSVKCMMFAFICKIFYFQRMIWTGCVQFFFFDVRISVVVVMRVRAVANTVRHVEKTSLLLKNSDLQIRVVCADSTVEAYACIYSLPF